MRWFVTPDLHGSSSLAERLLLAAGVPLTPGEREGADVVSVQLGDLANCVAADAQNDADLLRRAQRWYDVVLVGNHEHPYFGGPRFAGFFPVAEVEQGIRALERSGQLRPCLLAGDVLLTHAGVTPEWAFDGAAEAADAIEREWASGRSLPLFARIGARRGGSVPLGGVLWSDFGEPRAPFRQIHGHSPLPDGPYLHRRRRPPDFAFQLGSADALNLDVGARHGPGVVGAWLDEAGRVELVRCDHDEMDAEAAALLVRRLYQLR